MAWTGSSGGYLRLTGTKGASGRLTFSGRSVALYGPRASCLGLSAIYLDGVRVATVNQWSSTIVARQPLYLHNGLSLSTSHVLEVLEDELGGPGVDPAGVPSADRYPQIIATTGDATSPYRESPNSQGRVWMSSF